MGGGRFDRGRRDVPVEYRGGGRPIRTEEPVRAEQERRRQQVGVSAHFPGRSDQDSMFLVDASGAPLLEKIAPRVGDLEHRLDWLQRSYNPKQEGPGRARIEGEILALRAGILALRYHGNVIGGKSSVITALDGLVAAINEHLPQDLPKAVEDALEAAEQALIELGLVDPGEG